MNSKEFNQIIDKEIEYCENSPLKSELDSEYVRGFIKGLEQAKFLFNGVEEKVKAYYSNTCVVDRNAVKIVNVLDNSIFEDYLKSPEGEKAFKRIFNVLTKNKKPEDLPIPNLDKILEKYDGIIITGARGSGKTKTGLKVLEYVMTSGTPRQAIIAMPTHRHRQVLEPYFNLLSADYRPSCSMLVWEGKNQAVLCSTESPDSLRGSQTGFLWFEEPSKKNISQFIEQAQFRHRLDNRKVMITGTEYEHILDGTWLGRLNLYTYHLNLPI